MGTYANAILGYGYAWQDQYIKLLHPDEEEDGETEIDSDYIWDKWDTEASKQGLELGTHCCSEEPMLYLAAATVSTSQGNVVFSIKNMPALPPEVNMKLDALVERMGIEKPQNQDEPNWFLVAVYR